MAGTARLHKPFSMAALAGAIQGVLEVSERALLRREASMIQFALKISGAAAVAVGVLAIAFGSFWPSMIWMSS